MKSTAYVVQVHYPMGLSWTDEVVYKQGDYGCPETAKGYAIQICRERQKTNGKEDFRYRVIRRETITKDTEIRPKKAAKPKAKLK